MKPTEFLSAVAEVPGIRTHNRLKALFLMVSWLYRYCGLLRRQRSEQ